MWLCNAVGRNLDAGFWSNHLLDQERHVILSTRALGMVRSWMEPEPKPILSVSTAKEPALNQ